MSNDLYITFPSDFRERYAKYLQTFSPNNGGESGVMDILYNKTTGIGRVGDVTFKLKDGSNEYRIFGLLYDKINDKVNRIDVLYGAHFYEDGEDIDLSRKTEETNIINAIAKTIRTKTSLNTEQLVNNNGNLTLIGRKVENTPD